MENASTTTASSDAHKVSTIENFSSDNTLTKASPTFSSAKASGAKSSVLGCGGAIVDAQDAQFEQRVVEIVNAERDQAGSPPLKMVVGLTNAARYHAADLSNNDYFEHDSYDRINGQLVRVCEWTTRIQAYYPAPQAEFVAHGPTTPQEVVQSWMTQNSDGVLGEYREIGVGYQDDRWVQTLGTRSELYPLIINGEAIRTNDRNVSLYVYGDWEEIRLRTNGGEWSSWQPFSNQMEWALDESTGQQVIEAEMRNATSTATSSDMIEFVTVQ